MMKKKDRNAYAKTFRKFADDIDAGHIHVVRLEVQNGVREFPGELMMERSLSGERWLTIYFIDGRVTSPCKKTKK